MTTRVQPTGVNAEIRAGMARQGLRQLDVAKALKLSQASVADRLNGRREWRLSELQAVADLLSVAPADLLAAVTTAAPEADWIDGAKASA